MCLLHPIYPAVLVYVFEVLLWGKKLHYPNTIYIISFSTFKEGISLCCYFNLFFVITHL